MNMSYTVSKLVQSMSDLKTILLNSS